MIRALVLFCLTVRASCVPTTLVQFSPAPGYVQGGPIVSPGFAYAFQALAPPYSPTAYYTAAPNTIPAHVTSQYKTQYHSQDELGQYAYGYVDPDSSKHEVRTANGEVQGSFSYVDNRGVLQTTNYVADQRGYRVSDHSGIVHSVPQQVQYTPEVQAARDAHLHAVRQERIKHRLSRGKREAQFIPTYIRPKVHLLPPVYPENKIRYVPRVSQHFQLPYLNSYQAQQTSFRNPQIVSVTHHSPIISDIKAPSLRRSRLVPIPLDAATSQIFSTVESSKKHFRVPSTPSIFPPPPKYIPATNINSIPSSVGVPLKTAGSPQLLTQYHTQDNLGQYSYGYSGGPSSKQETRTADGVTRGSYSYIDGNGEVQTVHYVADEDGFRVAATNLPEGPTVHF